jgi:hypothetical protein
MAGGNDQLLDWLASVSSDPYAFVMGAFPWGEPGTRLENEAGPEPWQIRILCDIRDGLVDINTAIKVAVASGHGVGKSAFVSWIILWAVSTYTDTRGVVTANTENQLKTKTWAELGKWYQLFLGKELFKHTATAIFYDDEAHEKTWRIDMVPWSERNTEAFAGLHNKGRRILVVMDEASAIPDIIHETAEGALTDADTQIVWVMCGNPTRNTGRFKEAFDNGRFAKVWKTHRVDSREVSFTNKKQIQTWIDTYGEDSDFVRIRVLGIFPKVGEMEFFSAADIEAAMSREDVIADLTDPLAIGVDVARFGANASVIYFRRGRDGRSTPRRRYQGLDTVSLAIKVQEAHNELGSQGIFVDGGGVGGGVVDNLRNMHLFIYEIQFGGKPTLDAASTGTQGEKYANKRAEMYGAARAWIRNGGALPNDPDLKAQLLAITYTFNRADQIILTSKEDMMKDGKPSPDDADALVLTFAAPLQPLPMGDRFGRQQPMTVHEHDPFENANLGLEAA